MRVTSAESQPADQLDPAVVQAMAEIGPDISREFPKPLTTALTRLLRRRRILASERRVIRFGEADRRPWSVA